MAGDRTAAKITSVDLIVKTVKLLLRREDKRLTGQGMRRFEANAFQQCGGI
jgi:hypothetical protein